MVVYVEYAFAWNFLLDATLLWLSLRAVKGKIRKVRLLLSSLLGAAFALLFPLLTLPSVLGTLLKVAVGCLLCLLAFGRVKTKNEWGKYALNCTFFFAFTCLFGGAALSLFGEDVHKGVLLILFALLTVFSLLLIEKIYQKRAVEGRIYPCKIVYNLRETRLLGFYDSGNLASKNGLPVCFLSPDVFYDVWGEEIAFGERETGGQVCVEIAFETLAGKRVAKGRLGEVEIVQKKGRTVKKQVYFCSSANMLGRAYSLLLNARIFEENDRGKNEWE